MASIPKLLSLYWKRFRDPFRAIGLGDFFASSLQNQLVALEALQEALRELKTAKIDIQTLDQKAEGTQADLRHLRQDIQTLNQKAEGTDLRITRCRQHNFISEQELSSQNVPEESLIAFLFPMLRNRDAIDIGAHRGEFSRFLMNTGFSRVYAIEPHPQLIKDLEKIAKQQRQLRVVPCAVGQKDGQTMLHLAKLSDNETVYSDLLLLSTIQPHPLPKGLVFGEAIQVPQRSFASLCKKGEIPREAGLLKIDTEGNESVILCQIPAGTPYECILAEFWGPDFIFQGSRVRVSKKTAAALPEYPFTLSLARHGDGTLTFTANKAPTDQATWGNTFYFHDRELFQIAYQFIQNMIPEAV